MRNLNYYSMNKFIFNFEGEELTLPFSVSSMTAFLSRDLKIEHNGKLYKIDEKVVKGIDELSASYIEWDGESEIKSEMNIVFKMTEA